MFILKNSGGVLVEKTGILVKSGGVLVEKTGILVKSGGVLVESGGVLTCIYYIHIYFFGLDFNSKSFFFFIWNSQENY